MRPTAKYDKPVSSVASATSPRLNNQYHHVCLVQEQRTQQQVYVQYYVSIYKIESIARQSHEGVAAPI